MEMGHPRYLICMQCNNEKNLASMRHAIEIFRAVPIRNVIYVLTLKYEFIYIYI
jgi:hypothetical protein